MSLEHANRITYIGQTNYRSVRKTFGIKQADRRSHLYVIGKTGTGKSTLLENLLRQDISSGRGCAFLDPHGEVADRLASAVPRERQGDLVYFNVPDGSLRFNPLVGVPTARRALVASGILETFKKIWIDSWGPRLEHYLRYALLALLDQPRANLSDILRLFDNPAYRKHAAERVANPHVRQFWLREYESLPARLKADSTSPVRNKVSTFLGNPLLAQILTTEENSFEFRQIMDEGKILIVNLAKGKIGQDVSSLLGSLLVSMIGDAA